MAFGVIETHGEVDPPGTSFLIDNDVTAVSHQYEHLNLKHGTGKHSGIILVPQPSNDPNDPLLWPRWKKEAAFIVIFMNGVIFATLPGPLLASSTFALTSILGVTLQQVSELSGYQLLIVGAWGPFVSILAQKYGKRPQFLFAAVMGLVGTIICCAAKDDYHKLLAGRIVQGLGATAFESLSQATIGDIFYVHERGLRMAIIVLTLACMASMVSIISGVVTENLGWTYLFTLCLPFQIFGLLGTIFFLPESQFIRDPPVLLRHSTSDHNSEKDTAATAIERVNADQHSQEESGTISPANIPAKKTYLQTLAPFSRVYSDRNFLRMFGEIFVHLLNPAVLFILTTSAIIVSMFAGSAYIMAQIFSVPPYNLNAAENGYFFSGAFIGGLIAVSCGYICDLCARIFTKANKGIFEPEFRLPVNLLAAVFLGIGWFVFMWDVNNPTPNGYYLAAFCHGCICFGISITSTTGALYIVDAFRKYATEIFILQMMVKNFLFYAFSTFINVWCATDGAGAVFQTFGIVSLTLLATTIPMYIFGKVNRKMVTDLISKFHRH